MINILRSEWTKLRSVRSTLWTYLAAAVLMMGFGLLITISLATNGRAGGVTSEDAYSTAMSGTTFASIALATLGVLTITSEYRTGMIRTSLQAVPGRLRLLAGKAIVFTAVTFVYSLLLTFTTFFAGMLVLSRAGLATSLSAPGVSRALVGTALMLTASGLFGLALGALIRYSPGGIVAAIMLILAVPQLTQVLPDEWGKRVHDFTTTNAGNLITQVHPTPGTMGPWQGFAVYLVWIAVTGAVAAFLMKKRDA